MNDTTLLSTLTVGEFKELMREIAGKAPIPYETIKGSPEVAPYEWPELATTVGIDPTQQKRIASIYIKNTVTPHRGYDQSCNCDECTARRLRGY